MTQQNSELIDADNGIFLVLDVAFLKLFGPSLWQAKDINSPEAIGTAFSALHEETKDVIATLTLADVTGDESEPDTNELDAADIQRVDAFLRRAIESEVDVIEWQGSEQVRMTYLDAIGTQYVDRRGARQWVNISIRVTHQDRKFVAIGAFDKDWGGNLAAAVLTSLKTLEFVD